MRNILRCKLRARDAFGRDVQVRKKVQLELTYPTNGAKGLEWSQPDDVHLVWFIQRPDKIEAHADFVQQDLTHVMAWGRDGPPLRHPSLHISPNWVPPYRT